MQVADFVDSLKPMFNYVKLRKVSGGELKTGGIIVPETSSDYMEHYVVLDVGPGTKDGDECPCEVGDRVVVNGPAINIKGSTQGECLMSWIYLVAKYEPKEKSPLTLLQ